MARHSASTVRTLITAMIMATLSYAPPAVAQVNVWQRRIDDAAYYIASKQNNFALQNYFAAAVEAEKLKSKPHIYLSNLMLGNYYFQAKNYANAERYYYNAVSLYPREQGCLHDLEDTYTRLGKKSHATTVHQLISKLKSEDDSVDYGPFLTSLQQSVKQALGERIDDHPLGLKVSANPVFIIIVNANGELVAHCIEHSSGQRNVDQLTSACLDDASPFGSIPRHNSDTDTIINFNFMLNAVPNEQSVLGEKERSTKILSDAQKNFSAKNPLLVFYLREHAQNCVRSKSYDEALKYYQQALDFIDKNPASASSLSLVFDEIANCYFVQGKYGEAEAIYEEALKRVAKKAPQSIADVYHGYGSLLYKEKQYKDGDAMFAREKEERAKQKK